MARKRKHTDNIFVVVSLDGMTTEGNLYVNAKFSNIQRYLEDNKEYFKKEKKTIFIQVWAFGNLHTIWNYNLSWKEKGTDQFKVVWQDESEVDEE